MKKLLTLLALMIALAGCRGSTTDDRGKVVQWGIQILSMRGCDYVVYIKPGAATMVHAGDCSNPIHATRAPYGNQ